MAGREKVDDVFWRTRVDLHADPIEPPQSEWSDPTFDAASFLTYDLPVYAKRLIALAYTEDARRRVRARLQRIQRPGLHNLELGRCAGSYTRVKSKQWLERAKRLEYAGDKARCKWCYTEIPISYKSGKLIGHTPVGTWGKEKQNAARHTGS